MDGFDWDEFLSELDAYKTDNNDADNIDTDIMKIENADTAAPVESDSRIQAPEDDVRKDRKTSETGKSEMYDWIQCIVSALLICVLVFTFLARVVSVIGTSMVPTLEDADRIIVSNLFYTPDNGDIVVLRKESFRDEPIVKRVIAVAGDVVDIDFSTGIVYVNDVALEEEYVAEPTYLRWDFLGPLTIPEGYIFVMGDNRNASTDSRDNRVGLIDVRSVMGKVYFILFPGKNAEDERDFSRIGFVK